MNPFRTGKLVLFQVTYDREWHFFEIIFFVIIGIFGVCSPCTVAAPPCLNVDAFTTGSVWCIRCQVQSASRCFPAEPSCRQPNIRGCYAGHFDGGVLVLQQVFTDRHDGEPCDTVP